MMKSQRRWQIWRSPYFWLMAVALLALPLLADFNVRLAYSRQLTAEEVQIQQQIIDERARQTALKELEQYVKSDTYVEHWARMARLTKAGEVSVVPVPMEPARQTETAPSATRPANDIHSEWWLVIFDRMPNP